MGLVGDKIDKQKYIDKANQTEKKYGLPNNLLVGLLKTESNFDPEVISGRRKSSAGAIGIAQFMPGTAKDFGIDPRNADQSIDAAGRYLSQNYKKLGNWDDTLRSYNMGLGNVYKWKQGKINLPKETAEYVGKIYKNMGVNMKGDKSNLQPSSYDWDADSISSFVPKFINYGEFTYGNTPTASTEEDTKEEAEAKQLIDKAATEQQIIQDYFTQNTQALAQSQPQQQEQVQVYEAPTIGEQYAQVSQFLENPVAQEGRTINRKSLRELSKEQQDIIKKEIDFDKDWFTRRKNTFDKEGNPIPVEKDIFKNVAPFNPVVKSDKDMGGYYAYFSPESNITSLRGDFTNYPGTIAHERVHQYQKGMSPENWNKYVNLPSAYSMSLDTLMKNAIGNESEFTKYMRDPSEIHSFIQEVRYLNNLDPTVPVTDEMVKKLKYDKSNTLKDYYSDEEIKNFLNSMVSTQPKSYDTIAQQGGNIPVSSEGVYDYPMQEVIVPTQDGRITMQNVDYPILGVDEYGNKQMMYPNQEYQYSGKVIHEIPQLKNYFNKR